MVGSVLEGKGVFLSLEICPLGSSCPGIRVGSHCGLINIRVKCPSIVVKHDLR